MIVAVTGATGYVGRFIVAKLIADGMTVRAWRRPSSDPADLPPSIAWIEGELGAPRSFTPLVEGADALVHAALDHRPGRYRGGEGDDPARFHDLNVDASIALLTAARAAGVSRAVFLSSRAVFGKEAVGPLADDAPVSPDTLYGSAKAAVEAFVRDTAAEGWAISVLRPTGVYGVIAPVERSKWFSLVQDALAGRAVPARRATEVHGRDVAEAVLSLLRAPAATVAGRMFNCSDIVISHRDIVRLVQKISKVSGPLPEEGASPKAVMRPDALAALGVRFGGRELFEETVAELVAAAR